MQFNGYLIKINGITFPSSMIQLGSYKTTPNQIQDMDSYQDADGALHRNVLAHRRSKIEFNTKRLHLMEMADIQTFLKEQVRMSVEYWNARTGEYQTGEFYIPDIQYEIYQHTENDITYNPVRVALIEY